MWTYRARIIDVIDNRTVGVEVDLGFHVDTKTRVILAGVLAPCAQIEAWIGERDDGSPWPFIITLERVVGRDRRGEARESYVGTVTTPNGDSLNDHMAQVARAQGGVT